MKRPNTAVTLALALWMAVASAQTPPASTQRITPNFQNVDITVLAEAVGQATGITFIPDPRVRATVNLINPRPMTPNELYQAFLSILQVNNFAAVRTGTTGRVMKIVPEANVRQMANNPLSAATAGSDEVIDAVIEARNISGQQLNVVLRQLIPQSGSILSVPGTNSMIVTDRASNVFRLQRLVALLDQTGANAGVEMITLQNSNASDVVRTLTTLLAGTPADAGGVAAPRIAADDRSNSVLISGDPTARARVISYINNLDKAVNDNDNTEARYLKYARAEEVAAVLKQQASGITATAGATGAAAAPAVAGPAADRNVTILADKPTNLLIITAPPKTRRALFATVDKMDIARAQVMIEAFIADVSMDKSRNLGVNWAVFSQEDGKVIPGAVFNAPLAGGIVDIANTVANGLTTSSTIPTGFVGGVGKLSDTGLSWAALVNAIAADTENNVVAMPTQITADNEEVNLESGQEVPFLTGQYTNSGNNSGNNGNVNPFTTVQRQQIGTKLKITPQLNGSDAMTLTIDLESSELAGQSGDAGSAITNVRKFHNVVLVKDQQTIVVGGLIRDAKVQGETRVPFLGRIPILGNLFKYRTATRQKSNLMVFIRPTVLTDSLQASLATNEKYQAIRDAQQAQGAVNTAPAMLPFDKPPLLPPTPAPDSRVPVGPAPQTSPVP